MSEVKIMMLAMVCASLLAATSPADTPPPADVTQAYQDARAKAGRSPEDQVRLALWCEAHGLTAQRLHHLTLAVLADPKNATARGLMGLVAYNGRWLRPEVLAAKLKADPDHAATLAEYESKRLKVPYTADAQWALGLWAEEHGLKEQARAHLTAVIRLDPGRENAWKRLGYTRHGHRWMTEAQIAAEKAESDAQKQADKTWRPLLDRYRLMLDRPANRAEAENALADVTDPRAVPAIMHAFGTTRAVDQLRAVQLLGQVDSPMASRSLAAMAVFSKSPEVRRRAIETLKNRDPRDFVRFWIALIRKPIKYEFKPVGGPGAAGSLLVEGEKGNLKRVYSPPPMPVLPSLNLGSVSYDNNGLPVLHVSAGTARGAAISEAQFRALENQGQQNQKALETLVKNTGKPASQAETEKLLQAVARSPLNPLNNVTNVGEQTPGGIVRYTPVYQEEIQIPVGEMIRETQVSALVAQQQLISDVSSLEKTNTRIRLMNEPVLMALKAVTGGDLGDDGAAWNKWWTDQLGYATMASSTSDVPTYVEDVPIAYTPTVAAVFVTIPQPVSYQRTQHHSCFAAGTTVRTIGGERAIETIQTGDLVLVQDTKSGALGYQAVVAAYHNPPSATLRVSLSGTDPVVATGIHRFWKAGKGWTMARDLKAGDQVRTLEGVARVDAVEPDRTQPVFNLEVGEGHSFLVGKLGTLVHDNSLVEATPAPFDSGTPAAAVAKGLK